MEELNPYFTLWCSVLLQHRVIPELNSVVGVDIFTWFNQVLSQLDARKCAEVVTLCWAIWKARNKKEIKKSGSKEKLG